MNTRYSALPHIVIIGAGFGGLRAARALAKAPVRITLIDRNNYHLFQPLLYQVASGGVGPEEIAYPIRATMRRQKNVEFLMAEVLQADLAHKKLFTSVGEIGFDTLVVAVGGATNFFGLKSVEQFGFGLKSVEDAIQIRNHLLQQFELAARETDPEQRRAHLTFVIAGGGPTGVESAGAISELIKMMTERDFHGLGFSEARVVLVEAQDRLLSAMPVSLSEETQRALKSKGVEVRLQTAMAGYDGKTVTFKDGSQLPAYTLLWTAGVRVAPLIDRLGLAQMGQGRVKVEPTLQAPGFPDVFVIGDAAYLQDAKGAALPMVAPVAMQQADLAAKNIIAQFTGKPLQSFTFHDPGQLATIGRSKAVARLWGLNFKGLLAWMVWLVVHIMQLIGFRNRIVVLINWAADYLFFERSVRLILNPPEGQVSKITPSGKPA